MKTLKTLFWKELRENFKWALLAGVIVSGAMLYALKYEPQRDSAHEALEGLCGKSFFIVTNYGFLLVGLMLGFVQILTELRRDQWAFLIHRPLTMTQIFFGKAIPGVLLYWLATLAPLLAVAWWQSLPGARPAPFDWRMAIPGAVDAMAGLGFYFAALWSGLMRGPWYGRRALPLIVAYYLTQNVTTQNYGAFWYAMEAVLTTLTVIFLATWAAYQSAGIFRKEKWWGKVTTVLAALLALTVIQSWILTGWDWMFKHWDYIDTLYGITNQGELVKIIRHNSILEKVETIDGKELKPTGKEKFSGNDFLNSNHLNLNFWNWQTRSESWWRVKYYRRAEMYFLPLYGGAPGEYWFLDMQTNMFVRFDKTKKVVTGYLGVNGFAVEPKDTSAFKMSIRRNLINSNHYLCADEMVYVLDFSRKTAQPLFRQEADDPYIDFEYLYEHSRSVDKLKYFSVTTEKHIQVFTVEGRMVWSLPRPEQFKKGYVRIAQTDDRSRYFLIFYDVSNKARLLMELNATGEQVRQLQLPVEKSAPPRIDWQQIRGAVVEPIGKRLWHELRSFAWVNRINQETYKPVWEGQQPWLTYKLIYWSVSLTVGVLSALAGMVLVKRLQLSPSARCWWLVFIVFYGVGGLLAFWLVNDWPTRLACPRCGKKRSVADADCEHCGASWPLPVRDGTEIFEDSR
jgi:hypothetical protein